MAGNVSLGLQTQNPIRPNIAAGGLALCATGSTWKLYGAHLDVRVGGAAFGFGPGAKKGPKIEIEQIAWVFFQVGLKENPTIFFKSCPKNHQLDPLNKRG